MSYHKINNSIYRTDEVKLLRKRLILKERIRYYTNKLNELNEKLIEIEKQIDYFDSFSEKNKI
jgi:hypothetical protein